MSALMPLLGDDRTHLGQCSSRAEESHLRALPELIPFVDADEGMAGAALTAWQLKRPLKKSCHGETPAGRMACAKSMVLDLVEAMGFCAQHLLRGDAHSFAGFP